MVNQSDSEATCFVNVLFSLERVSKMKLCMRYSDIRLSLDPYFAMLVVTNTIL